MAIRELSPRQLYHPCDPDQFSFETTADLEHLAEPMGQPRAIEAVRFGVGIEHEGYNVFALGIPGTGRHYLVRHFLEKRAATEEVPSDYCYVNSFIDQHKPALLRLPPGRGREFSADMEKLVEEAQNTLKAAFEDEEYQNRRQTITQEFQEQQQSSFEEIRKKAEERNLTVLRTPAGLAVAPVREGNVISPDEFRKLPEEEQKRLEKEIEEIQQETQRIFQNAPKWQRELRERLKELNREVTSFAVGPLIQELRAKYEDTPDVTEYLESVEKDIVDNVQLLLPQDEGQQQPQQLQQIQQLLAQSRSEPSPLRRYRVNVLIDHSDSEGAPVVYEDNPTYQNLLGRAEHMSQMGALVTDFNMIRAGALHRANGGYLIVDALKILQQPSAWEGLKRALKSRQIKIESLGQLYSLISTVSLEPEPVPLDVKVLLVGDPWMYHLLRYYDPEFGGLFKVLADFAMQMDRTPENHTDYGKLIGTVARKEKLRHFDRTAVARVIEHSARAVGDGEKMSIHMQQVTDLLRQADYWAGQNGNGTVTAADVQAAIDSWVYRSDRLRERVQEDIRRGTIYIDTEATRIGQVNGLSVAQMGDFAFGRPNRITGRVRLGKGEVIDIEREVKMGGPIHSKGVLILSGFLGARYAEKQPLSLSASLVFEQSYGGIEGDSASSAELYALLSAISEVPIKQSIAVTGSVNQHGHVQPIGGVNEKIEGFFDTCKAKGLSGEQGVIIPASNAKHLMLRQDVIQAVQDGRFHVYSVETIDEGIEILTGVPAGEPDDEGNYPPDSVNGKVRARLAELAQLRSRFSKASPASKEGGPA